MEVAWDNIAQAKTSHAFSECGQMRPVSRKLEQVPVRLTACISSTATSRRKPLSVHTIGFGNQAWRQLRADRVLWRRAVIAWS